MQRALVYYNNKILLQRCDEITEITPEIRELARDLIDTMIGVGNGIGLAAPQIGVLKRMFVVLELSLDENGEESFGDPKIYINPKLSDPSSETGVHNEGCLSIPKLYVPVVRPEEVTIEAIDLEGNPIKERVKGFYARMIMHETDHLNGKLMTHRTDLKTKKKITSDLEYINKTYNL